MDTMGFIFGMTGFTFGLLGFISATAATTHANSATAKVEKLEQRLREAGILSKEDATD